MGNASAIPFSFTELNDSEVDEHAASDAEQSAVRFTAEELEEACVQAADTARAEAIAGAVARQNEILAAINSELSNATANADNAVNAHIHAINSAAADLLSRFCKDIAEAREVEAAQKLIADYLAALAVPPRALLTVSSDCGDGVVSKLKAFIKKSDASDTVSIAEDPALAPGDIHLEWREGSAERNIDKAIAELSEILRASPTRKPSPRKTRSAS